MQDQDAAPTPQVDAISRALEHRNAMCRPAFWMKQTAKLFLGVTLGTLGIELLVEAFLGHPIDRALPLLFEMPLLIPVVAVGIWWATEMGRFREAFYKLRRVLGSAQKDAPQSIPLSALGPLLEVTLAAAGTLPIGEYDEIAPATTLLGSLLQSIQVENDVVLTLEQRRRLNEIVGPGWKEYWNLGAGGVGGKNTALFLKVCDRLRPGAVHALGWLGDSASIPVLERFANKTNDAALRSTALQSLEQIRERVRYGPEQMLRSSDVSERPDTLLRTASADDPQNHQPRQLLRADPTDTER